MEPFDSSMRRPHLLNFGENLSPHADDFNDFASSHDIFIHIVSYRTQILHNISRVYIGYFIYNSCLIEILFQWMFGGSAVFDQGSQPQ